MKPTVQRIITEQGTAQLDGTLNITPDAILEEFRAENFQDDVSSFVTSDLDAMISYRTLIHARNRWSAWAQRISWSVYLFLAAEFIFTIWFGLANRVFNHPLSFRIAVAALQVRALPKTLFWFRNETAVTHRMARQSQSLAIETLRSATDRSHWGLRRSVPFRRFLANSGHFRIS